MRIFLPLLFMIGLAMDCRAQETHFLPKAPQTDVVRVIKLNILSPGIGVEQPIGRQQTLYLQGMMSLSTAVGYSSTMGWLSELYLDPALLLEYRYYYGWQRRLHRGRRVAMNSANYLAGFFRTDFPNRYYLDEAGNLGRYRKPIHAIGATIGMQRNYRKRFSLDLNIGIGHTIEPTYADPGGYPVSNNSQFYIPGRLSLGIWLNKRA